MSKWVTTQPATRFRLTSGHFRMNLLSHAINLMFPSACNNCNSNVPADAYTPYFCSSCWEGIEWFNCQCCRQCGLPYSPHPDSDYKPYSGQPAYGHLCGSCREKPPPFDMAVSAGRYSGTLAEAIKLFKYNKKIQLGRRLIEQALKSSSVESTLQNLHNPDTPEIVWGCPAFRADTAVSAQTLIIPVPLHTKRLREREFNQSAIIGSVLGKKYGLPMAASALVRHRYTKPQVELDASERKENVTGAFSVEDRTMIEGKKVILVDDVYTSGSTLNECTRVLKKNGADKVYVVTIARMTW